MKVKFLSLAPLPDPDPNFFSSLVTFSSLNELNLSQHIKYYFFFLLSFYPTSYREAFLLLIDHTGQIPTSPPTTTTSLG
jgi:hypothetical protein